MKRKETTFPTLRYIVGNDASLLINLQQYHTLPSSLTPPDRHGRAHSKTRQAKYFPNNPKVGKTQTNDSTKQAR